jgi:catechol 2,3-dioxygenase-like lactoylglutathione lyase family enzyme
MDDRDRTVTTAYLILYVKDQARSVAFYSRVLDRVPVLDVPGMAEFAIRDGCVLGVMPEDGIVRLLGDGLRHPSLADGVARSELYLVVDDPAAFHARALHAGARELSPVLPRDWGHVVGYSLDPDGHVLAFARTQP